MAITRRKTGFILLGLGIAGALGAAIWLASGYLWPGGSGQPGYIQRFDLSQLAGKVTGAEEPVSLADAMAEEDAPAPDDETDESSEEVTPDAEPSAAATDAPQVAVREDVRPGASFRGLLDSGFDLADPDGSGESITVQKSLFAKGASLGKLDLQISDSARIRVNGDQLGALLASHEITPKPSVSRLLAGGGFVEINALRAAGAGLSYDAVKDILVLAD